MNLEGLSSVGPAQRSLARLLRTAYADENRAAVIVQRALSAADLDALPELSTDLLEFVKTFLVPMMTNEVGPRLVAALLDDLEAEIEHEKATGDPFSSSRLAVSTRLPPPGEDYAQSEPKLPRGRQPSLSDLVTPMHSESPFDARTVEIAVPKIPAHSTAAPPPPTRKARKVARPAVILVDADRFGRASLARAMVQAQCDVTVLDDVGEVMKVLESNEPLDVLVADVDGIEIDPLLRTLVRLRPDVPVVAWTKSTRAIAEHVLMTNSVQHYEIVPKGARSAEVIEVVRRLAEGG